MAVVKADGYGHGAVRMAQACVGAVHSFGVACVSEAEHLREHGILEPIYLLGAALPQELERVVAGGFRPVISTVQEGAALATVARAQGVRVSVLWALDTGMGRCGTLPLHLPEMVAAWAGWPQLQLDSIGSHFPSADEDREFTEQQTRHFLTTVQDVARHGLIPEHVQISNSAGIMGYPSRPHELVRAGLMLYGVAPLPQMQAELLPVLTWKTSVTLVRELPAGWGVNYGRSYITTRPMLTATLAVGYADGYLRALSHKDAAVLVRGQRCPLLGRVTMDQLVVDASALADAVPPLAPGEEAVLIGRQGTEEITTSELAQKAGTIPWEIFTNIKH
jgi:alanine racemase